MVHFLISWRLALAALSGIVGWSGLLVLLPCAMGVIAAWLWSRTRVEAYLATFFYYSLASIGLIKTAAVFLSPTQPEWGLATLLWLTGNVLLSSVWGGLWSPFLRLRRSSRLCRGTAVALFLAVPPLGLVGWANPWTVTGVLLPGAGFLGLALFHIVLFSSSRSTFAIFGALMVIASIICCSTYQEKQIHLTFWGQSTAFGRISVDNRRAQIEVVLKIRKLLEERHRRIVLLPESVGGLWTPSSASRWRRIASETRGTLVVGALRHASRHLQNGVAVVGPLGTMFWPQRVPIPVGMWAPWSQTHVEASLFAPAVRDLGGYRTTVLMCFEQLIPWPALDSAIEGTQVVLAPANLWFAHGTNINAIRGVAVRAWARLFDWALVEAVNE